MAMLKRDLTNPEYVELIKREIRQLEISCNHVYSRKGKRDIEKRIEWLKSQISE